jgi:hypothetical protein
MKYLLCAVLVQDTSSWPLIEPLPSYGRGRELPGGRYISLIHGSGLQDVVITGSCFCGYSNSHIKLLYGLFQLYSQNYHKEITYSCSELLSKPKLKLQSSITWCNLKRKRKTNPLFAPYNGIPSYKIKSSVKLFMMMIVFDGNCNVFR